ncbi:Rieske (2Fe-2S) protein [Tessaracoccus sp. OS52]|uniref:QcrA and Rieske domain-containing protein n=1 Tax=Tessaracoccus sp. OS52 TaxID=2886691 RepID=UPI001D126C5B|nr:Rieske (2Fe-2S) protein [Tessaracoccus sp. OS52]MCC2593363.1 Rieske (2Fe-2S) protein [Tessaracoccus sp. OS52]
MSTRREVLITGAAIATSLLASGCAATESRQAAPDSAIEVDKSQVPVGGGIVLADPKIVVTQPVEGTFLAFSAVCTHQGCTVRDVKPEGINCACHGSVFDTGDGSPIAGPASEPLQSLSVEDSGNKLIVAA